MGKVTGFKEFKRIDFSYQPVEERVTHYNEFTKPLSKKEMQDQAARCMECGVPFCHSSYGCPLANTIPQFNDQVYADRWESAFRTLMSTNNFPEFTGRICPAICETACVLGLNEKPVTIRNLEYSIIEKAYAKGWMEPLKIETKTGKKVAVVGGGPAGMSVADQLNKAGHEVTVYEKAKRVGGLVRYGIPNFKLDKQQVVQRRVDLMQAEGIKFITEANVGVNIPLKDLQNEFDAVVLCIGAGLPRDLPIENRDSKGVYFAMEFLGQNNSVVEGETFSEQVRILATDKDVLVIGGGDTGSDCVGTSIRQKAKSVTQIELLPQAPLERTEDMPWPTFPRVFKLSSSQAEGCKLDFNVLSKSFIKGANGEVRGVNCVRIEWEGRGFKEIAGSEFVINADLVLLAMGFLGPEQDSVIKELAIETDERSNIKTTKYATSAKKIFAAGDGRRGQSLVVWAIAEGRECAIEVDEFLMNRPSLLNAKNRSLSEFRR